jgi:hypothetical protein
VAQSANTANSVNRGITRSIFRWIHIVFAIPILGYIYSPFEKLPDYAPATRFVFLPVMVLTGFWMWKGHMFDGFCRKDRPSKMLQIMPSRLVASLVRKRRALRRPPAWFGCSRTS